MDTGDGGAKPLKLLPVQIGHLNHLRAHFGSENSRISFERIHCSDAYQHECIVGTEDENLSSPSPFVSEGVSITCIPLHSCEKLRRIPTHG